MVFFTVTYPYSQQANVQDALSLDLDYLFSRPQPVAPWGQQLPHKWVMYPWITCSLFDALGQLRGWSLPVFRIYPTGTTHRNRRRHL
jgi:hypothetical protein